MTEAEWLAATDPTPMLEFLRDKVNDRKLRLFAVACCRRAWRLMGSESSQKAVDAAGAMAEGALTEAQRQRCLEEAYYASHQARLDQHSPGDAPGQSRTSAAEAAELSLSPFGDDVLLLAAARASADALAYEAASQAAPAADARWRELNATGDDDDAAWNAGWNVFRNSDFFRTPRQAAATVQAGTIRCVLGNPFRPVAVDPSWLTSTVVALADGIYQERAFDRMPILADALQDAGCDHADILGHCRGGGPHVRGCWVVDLVLGKN